MSAVGVSSSSATTITGTSRIRTTVSRFGTLRGTIGRAEPSAAAVRGSGDVAESFELLAVVQPLERVVLELAHLDPRETQCPHDLLDRPGLLVAGEPVAQRHHRPLGIWQLRDRAAQALAAIAVLYLALGRGVFGDEEVSERCVLVLADRTVEARDGACRLAHLEDLLLRELNRGGQFFVVRLPAQLGGEHLL